MLLFAEMTAGQMTKLGVGSLFLFWGVLMVIMAHGYSRCRPRTNAGTAQWEERQEQKAWLWALGAFGAAAYFFARVFPGW
jgi:hypothetical protein